jgi:hypothetical protein
MFLQSQLHKREARWYPAFVRGTRKLNLPGEIENGVPSVSIQRLSILAVVVAVTAVFVASCGTDNSGANASGDSTATATPMAASTDTSQVTSNGGIDPACVEQVLGRTVTGFGDITDAERTKVFAECSAGGGAAQAGGPRSIGFDPACVSTALGEDVPDITQLTPEQRATVFQQCGFAGAGGFGGGRGFGGGGGFRVGIDLACASEQLGIEVTDITQLTPEQRTQVFEACRPADAPGGPTFRFGDGTPGPDGGTRVRPDFSQIFDAACVTDALGHSVTDFTTLTPEEQQTLFAKCAPNFGGFGGRGQVAPGN